MKDIDPFRDDVFHHIEKVIGLPSKGVPDLKHLNLLLPSLKGKHILEIGCRRGWFARWCFNEGAAHIDCLTGPTMLSEASKEGCMAVTVTFEAISNLCHFGLSLSIERLDQNAGSGYDLISCFLTLHYSGDLRRIVELAEFYLVTGGHFVFSVEHPMRTAPKQPQLLERDDIHDTRKDKHYWPMSDYADEGKRHVEWLGYRITRYHYTLQTYFRVLRDAGFKITDFKEWGYGTDQVRHRAGVLSSYSEEVGPAFALFVAKKEERKGKPIRWRIPLSDVLDDE
ncbi:S-adenosyl-L-methionine-dependent methyltransferase [Xylariaceae sp. FL1019]|nr:S-adenosyl-L-methionine-dependent methyltransferase [Xylariaceae sp. FL1019]